MLRTAKPISLDSLSLDTPVSGSDTASSSDSQEEPRSRAPIILDVRNSYEWDAGHFSGAERPKEEEFSDTPRGEGDDGIPAYLKGADPEAPVMVRSLM